MAGVGTLEARFEVSSASSSIFEAEALLRGVVSVPSGLLLDSSYKRCNHLHVT